ncbi:DUF6959 family protein [Catellatospora citrea]|uniref:Uncharacterized protein n=1 Tax=Catellatospora citrea TaxID=53366 RepID=A0A8J3P2B9_9ACTN|nr:hypothetical protein [Catellatospora citrea]RKE06362.1 hypothetical protein C8E86_1182 [Catellatospora citrea]GIG01008.1 hypothetical protein Cci01nite_61010 [Catellatospora citrea]
MKPFEEPVRPTETTLLDRAGNIAVVHLPGRAFPGVHIQGDTLSVLRTQLADAARVLREAPGEADALDELDYAVAELNDLLAYYERVLARHGMRRPY